MSTPHATVVHSTVVNSTVHTWWADERLKLRIVLLAFTLGDAPDYT